ncbi:MAG: hypothetical protein ACTSR8_09255 [Promethearchaeota archaeon]
MRFCPKCDNLLIPKNQKFYCRVCNDWFNIESNAKNEYVLVKTIEHDEADFMPIIIKNSIGNYSISNEDRKAFEDYFKFKGET